MQKTTKTRRPISGPRATDGQIQADISSRSLRNSTLIPRRPLLPRMAPAILHPSPLVGPPPRHTKPSTEPSAKHADEHPDEKDLTSGSALVHGATVSRTKKIRRPFFDPRKTKGQYTLSSYCGHRNNRQSPRPSTPTNSLIERAHLWQRRHTRRHGFDEKEFPTADFIPSENRRPIHNSAGVSCLVCGIPLPLNADLF